MHGQHVEIKEGPYTFRSEGKAWLYGELQLPLLIIWQHKKG
jgi:hypothetical protein